MGGADAKLVPFTDLHRSSGEGGEEALTIQRDEEGETNEASGRWEEHFSGTSPTGGLG